MSPKKVAECWTKLFPNSTCTWKPACLGSDVFFTFHLVKDGTECPNGYLDNDPLRYIVRSSEDGTFSEIDLCMYVTPDVGSYDAYKSVRLRKVTTKNVDAAKLLKRFQRVRLWVEAELPNLKNPKFDITTK